MARTLTASTKFIPCLQDPTVVDLSGTYRGAVNHESTGSGRKDVPTGSILPNTYPIPYTED